MKLTHQASLLALLLTLSQLADAYVGPGAGISAIGSVIAFIGACLLVIIGFVWYPVKRLLKKNKAKTADQEDAIQTDTTALKTENKPEQ